MRYLKKNQKIAGMLGALLPGPLYWSQILSLI